jgi:FkbM family methyltransferase
MRNRLSTITIHGLQFLLSVQVDDPDVYHQAAGAGTTVFDWPWQFTMQWLQSTDIFYDIGANIGTVAIPASMRSKKVYAFELLRENVDHLRAAALANKLDNIHIMHAAVSDSVGMTGATGSSAWAAVDASRTRDIVQITVDDFIGVSTDTIPNLVKIDVEGIEKNVLLGMQDLMATKKPDIVIESNAYTCGSNGYSYHELLGIMRSRGYSIYRLFNGRLVPRDSNDLQEVIVCDYFATTKSTPEIRARSFDIGFMDEDELAANLKNEAERSPIQRDYTVAIWDELPPSVQQKSGLTPMVESRRREGQDVVLDTLAVGASRAPPLGSVAPEGYAARPSLGQAKAGRDRPAGADRTRRARSFLPTLSVLVAVHENGGLTAAALEAVRLVADEIVVAFDARISVDQLGPLEAVADTLIGFEFSGANRFRPWLREQAQGEWLLLLDGDEVVSTALLDALPELISNRNVSGYELPRWWAFPDAASRLVSPPWDNDRHLLRLVRNDGRLWFPGVKHSGAICEPPTRFADAAFIHLDLLVNDLSARHRKVARYDSETFPMFARNGRLVNEAFYLPEADVAARTTTIPVEDRERITAVLARQAERGVPSRQAKIVPSAEVERWWSGNPASAWDHLADIAVVRAESNVPAAATARIEVEVKNLGRNPWPASSMRQAGTPVFLSYHWRWPDGSIAVWDGRCTSLASRVAPGEQVRVDMMIDAPADPGRYVLVLDLVHDGVCWFGVDREIAMVVEPGVRDQLLTSGKSVLIPVAAATEARRRLREVDGLAIAMRSREEETVDPPLELPLDEWTLDAAVLNYLRDRMRSENVKRALEFGSGASTILLAREVAGRNGHVLSIEQEGGFADRTNKALIVAGADMIAEVMLVGLAATWAGGIETLCYDLKGVAEERIRAFDPDLVVIDGPPQQSGASRLAVAPLMAPLLTRATPFVMHDAFRDAELEIGRRWQADPAIKVDGILAIGKGILLGWLHPS